MTPEALFLSTIDDLDQRLRLGRGEYDALCIAWLLRRLFQPDGHSLVSLANAGPTLDLSFGVRDDMPPTEANIAGWMRILPTNDGRPTVELPTSEFLNRTTIVTWPGNAPERRCEISVKRLILFLANKDGAVHWSKPKTAWERALAEFRDWNSFQTANGEYTGGVFCLIDVARVARAGLEPLRVLLAPNED